ncbi:MAG: hydantoinase/oxoprolinase family protein [Chloroflexi bacterium]|nr:hydantoinase/oxoprolinase family protein [Chloroflexota bacterium]
MLIGIDIGGTFTDIVLLSAEEGEVTFIKVPSTPGCLKQGVIDGLQELARQSGLRFSQVDRIVHGTTVATNALLEGKWARTALVTTDGFRDVIEIGRQNRPAPYDLMVERPRPIVSRDLRFEIPERVDYEGKVVEPLNEAAVQRAAEEMSSLGVESVAVSFLFSYVNPEHERTAAQILNDRLRAPVSLSSDVLPEFREYERTMTVAINAALRPIVGDYLSNLEDEARQLGINRGWQIMQSNAGITSSHGASTQPVSIVLSGPAAGVQGAMFAAAQAGFQDVISIDMGGTSCDVCLIREGQAAVATEGNVAGYPIKVPMVAVHTIAAGGGSIAWIDQGGALRVGPRSAGADPGPACYGKGGRHPTVTDAHLVLGRLDAASPIGGLNSFDLDRARAVIETEIATPLKMTVEAAAEGILTVAEANMERAIRVVSVERGHDPREFALLAFGGAGPLHGATLASKLGITRVLVPEAAGVLSALGLLQTDLMYDSVQSVVRETGKLDLQEINTTYERLRVRDRERLISDGAPEGTVSCQPSLDMRYLGQSHELNLKLSDPVLTRRSIDALVSQFHQKHLEVYGHAAPGEPVELVNLRLRSIGLAKRVDIKRMRSCGCPGSGRKRSRLVHFGQGGWIETQVLDRGCLAENVVTDAPAIIEGKESTVVIPPGWRASVDRLGNLVMMAERTPVAPERDRGLAGRPVEDD